MNSSLARQHFHCTRLRVVLTRAACARSHKLASTDTAKAGQDAIAHRMHDRCRGCVIGAEHRAGKASQPPVTLVPLRTHKLEQPRWCLACGKPLLPERYRKSFCGLECKQAGRRMRRAEIRAEVGL